MINGQGQLVITGCLHHGPTLIYDSQGNNFDWGATKLQGTNHRNDLYVKKVFNLNLPTSIYYFNSTDDFFNLN